MLEERRNGQYGFLSCHQCCTLEPSLIIQGGKCGFGVAKEDRGVDGTAALHERGKTAEELESKALKQASV